MTTTVWFINKSKTLQHAYIELMASTYPGTKLLTSSLALMSSKNHRV